MRRWVGAFALVLMLIPVVAVSAPTVFDGLQQWIDQTDSRLDDIEQRVSTLEGGTSLGTTTSTQPTLSTTTSSSSTATTTVPGATTTTTFASTTTLPATTTTTPTATTTTTRTTTTQPPPPSGGATITGTVCPNTVTGTAILVGNVNLTCDLVVDGGTLIARSGVNVEGNGFQIQFVSGAVADLQGTPVFTWSGDGSNANLNRDVTFNNMRRIIFMDGAGASVLRYIAVTNSGTSTLGDYPLHWHLNGDTTRGTLVEGVVVVNGAHHAFVPHGSHGITFKNTIAKNIIATAYWWDPPGSNNCDGRRNTCTVDNSNDITYDHVLVDGVAPKAGSNGHRISGFQLGAGSGNIVRNSGAINIVGGSDCSGFHWNEQANRNDGGNVWVFKNNFSVSDECHGIFVWQNDPNVHIVDGFVGSGIEHGAYGNFYDYRNIDVPYLIVHAQKWQMSDSSVGDVLTKEHNFSGEVIFDNVAMTSFTIDNASHEPGHYILNNTGLSCGDIVYESVEPGTTVTIDGFTC